MLIDMLSNDTGLTVEEVGRLMEESSAPIYADLHPDMFVDESLVQVGIMNGVAPDYREWRDWGLPHTVAYFAPDAMYSLCMDVVGEMEWLGTEYDRGSEQCYFDALTDECRRAVLFEEAVLKHQGLVEWRDILYEARMSGNIEFEYNVLPYRSAGCTVRDAMLAAACLVGDVRYVWGGGHTILEPGIPVRWQEFNDSYNGEAGCLVRTGGLCPVHGEVTEEFHGELEEDGTYSHALDGLDCSGFASWLFTEVTGVAHSALAGSFVGSSTIEEVPLDSDVMPCDVFAWEKHIVVVVGECGRGAYVTVEATPDILRYGVLYRAGASVGEAVECARQANLLVGGDEVGPVKIYCMDGIDGAKLGRSNMMEEVHGVKAVDILQDMFIYLPRQYCKGWDTYDGNIFDKAVVIW